MSHTATKRMVPEGLRDAAKVARKAGWVIAVNGSGHLKWIPPAGRFVVTPESPGGGNRAVKNSLADLRRAGLAC